MTKKGKKLPSQLHILERNSVTEMTPVERMSSTY